MAIRDLVLPALVASSLLVGCTHIGPRTLPRDRFDYTQALKNSAKEQFLLNLVGLRYGEAPLFLDVASVINQYSVEGQLNLASSPYKQQAAAAPPVGVAGSFAERPTVTYIPVTGAKFTESVLTPIAPATVMSLLQAGWSADFVLRLAVSSINGVTAASFNRVMRARGSRGDSNYLELVKIFDQLQNAGAMSIRVEQRESGQTVILILQGLESPDMDALHTRAAEILGIEGKRSEFVLVTGQRPRQPGEIAMMTRSMLEILLDLSAFVDVPEEHLSKGWTRPGADLGKLSELGFEPLIRVRSGTTRPDEAFAAVRYEGTWFWIDNQDLNSKRTLSVMQFMFALAERAPAMGQPVVTVQAGGG